MLKLELNVSSYTLLTQLLGDLTTTGSELVDKTKVVSQEAGGKRKE